MGSTVSTMAPNGLANTSWQYGYIEVNAAFANVAGEWPALWMQSNTGATSYVPTVTNHQYAEIDIFEWQGFIPTTFNGHVHAWEAAAGSNVSDIQNNDSNSTAALPGGTNLNQYHTYGLLWTPIEVSWYFDNQLMLTATSTTYPTIFSYLNAGPAYLLLTNQVGNNWSLGSGVPSSATNMTVQWAHVWH